MCQKCDTKKKIYELKRKVSEISYFSVFFFGKIKIKMRIKAVGSSSPLGNKMS